MLQFLERIKHRGQSKIRVYLNSGEHIDIWCKNASFTHDNTTGKYSGYTITGAEHKFGISLDAIIAWEQLY